MGRIPRNRHRVILIKVGDKVNETQKVKMQKKKKIPEDRIE